MMRGTLTAALAALVAIGCGGTPEPEVGAAPEGENGNQEAAVSHATEAASTGVVITAELAEPTGGEAAGGAAFTPVTVRIANNSEQPVRLGMDNFILVAPNGSESAAIPVYKLDPSMAGGAVTPQFQHENFAVASEYAQWFPDVEAWQGQFQETDMAAYEGMRVGNLREAAPDPNMIAQALPEGVIRQGGWVSGVLWFGDVPSTEAGQFQLRTELVNPETGEQWEEMTVQVARVQRQEGAPVEDYPEAMPPEADTGLMQPDTAMMEPDTGYMQQPDTGYMQEPDTGYMQEPDTGYMQEPDTGYMQEPDTGFMQQPDTGYMQEPDTGYMQEPDTGYMQEPDTGYMQEPDTGYMQQPDTGYMQQPDTGFMQPDTSMMTPDTAGYPPAPQ